jgi:hypothetical protein
LQFCRFWQENSVRDQPSIERKAGRDVSKIAWDRIKENFQKTRRQKKTKHFLLSTAVIEVELSINIYIG